MPFHFFARFEPLPGMESAFRDELLRVIAPSREEAGCLGIEVFEALREPLFAIHSQWLDEAAFELHAQLPTLSGSWKLPGRLLSHPVKGMRLRLIAGGGGAGALE